MLPGEYYTRSRAIDRKWTMKVVAAAVAFAGCAVASAVFRSEWLLYVGMLIAAVAVIQAADVSMKATNALNEERGPRVTDDEIKERGFQDPEQLVDATDGWWLWEKIPLSTAVRYKRWWRPSK